MDSFSTSSVSLTGSLSKKMMTGSGYPLLSPTSITLVQAIVTMLYQIQHTQPWSKAITNVSRVNCITVYVVYVAFQVICKCNTNRV